MAKTYEQIASTTLGSNTALLEFADLPQTFTDLILVAEHSFSTASNTGTLLIFNTNDATGKNSSYTNLTSRVGAGYGAGSARGTSTYGVNISTQNLFDMSVGVRTISIAHIFSYANTSVYKTILSSCAIGGNQVGRQVSLWQQTSNISKIFVSGPFAAGSKFKLYGLVG